MDDVTDLHSTQEHAVTGFPGPEATATAGVTAARKIVAPKSRKPAVRDPTIPLMPGQAKIGTIKYTDAMNKSVMKYFSDEAALGTFRVMKSHYLTDGFERISTKMAKEYPIFDWNMEKIRTKFDTEKRRLRAWLTWRDGFSGASFDEEGRAVGTPEQISHFLASNPKREWLFTQGLQDSNQYLDIFDREKPGGLRSKEVTQAINNALRL